MRLLRPHPTLAAALLLFAVAVRAGEQDRSVEESLRKGAGFLWAQQDGDGGWHSKTYGLLRSGQALTPFVLNTLLQIPESTTAAPKEKIDRAVAFIKAHLNADGALGMSDPKLHDYPNYATALAIHALARRGGESDTVAHMQVFLRSQQFSGDAWTSDHPAFGAWGMGGVARTPREPGHLDLSMTRNVLDALRACAPETHGKAFENAQTFLRRCQNLTGDGGFLFSTVVLDANKAGVDRERCRSYGTATADGILALLDCDVSEDDPRVKAALKWTLDRSRVGAASGFPSDSEKRWDTGLQFYYYAAIARVYRKLVPRTSDGGKFRAELAAHLLKTHRADGSWVNENFLVKEDDPCIATVFALGALIDLQEWPR